MENQLFSNQSLLVEQYYDLCKLARDLTNTNNWSETTSFRPTIISSPRKTTNANASFASS